MGGEDGSSEGERSGRNDETERSRRHQGLLSNVISQSQSRWGSEQGRRPRPGLHDDVCVGLVGKIVSRALATREESHIDLFRQ